MFSENAQILFALTIAFLVPVVLVFLRNRYEKKAVVVTVRVIKVEEVKGQNNSFYYPTFEIVAGDHKGIKYRSHWDAGPTSYKVGELAQANFIKESNEIFPLKKTTENWSIWFTPFFLILAALIFNILEGYK